MFLAAGKIKKVAASGSTWNPSDKTASMALSGGNLIATASDVFQGVRGTTSHASGKFYFEVTVGSTIGASDQYGIGIATGAEAIGNRPGLDDSLSAAYFSGTAGLFANSGAYNPFATQLANGSVVGIAVDITNHLVYFAKDNTWQDSADPAAGTGGADYIATAAVFPRYYGKKTTNNQVATLNVGSTAFSYTPPTGFSAWG